jgi:hypothetical protein
LQAKVAASEKDKTKKKPCVAEAAAGNKRRICVDLAESLGELHPSEREKYDSRPKAGTPIFVWQSTLNFPNKKQRFNDDSE